MKIMAVDLGDRRTGIAVSDETGLIAGEAFVIEEFNTDRLLRRVASEAAGRTVAEIVVGRPRNMNGTEGERAKKSGDFAERLQSASGIPVVLWDERRTTVDAHRILHESKKHEKKYRKYVDAVAASIILQNYLDYKNRK